MSEFYVAFTTNLSDSSKAGGGVESEVNIYHKEEIDDGI